MWKRIEAWFNPYKRYLEWAVLALVFIAGYKTCDILDKAARTTQVERVIEYIPKFIERTNTIIKVIHDSNDACSHTAIPKPILDELRKQ